MTWFKVDDGLHSHRKAMRAGVGAMGLWVLAGSWCADNLTDGFIPDYAVGRLDPDHQEHAARLVSAGLWVEAEYDGDKGWQFHEWNEPGRQPTRAEVLADRDTNAARQKAWRDRKRAERNAARDARLTANVTRNEPVTNPVSNGHRNAVTDAVTNGVRNPLVTASVTGAPTRPVPTRPDPSVVPTELQEDQSQTLFPLASRNGEIEKPKRSTTTARNTDDPLFGEFYNAYPRKKEPTAARKAWDRAVKDFPAELIIAAAKRYATERHGQDPQFTPYPASWLNAGGFRSEPDPPGTDVTPHGGQAVTNDGRSLHRKTAAHFDHLAAYGGDTDA